MKVVKKDAFDTYKFNTYWKAQPDLMKEFRGGIKFNNSFKEDCEDVFAALFRKKWRYEKEIVDPHLQRYLDSLRETTEFHDLRRTTVMNPGEAFEGMKRLMEGYDRSGKEDNDQKRRVEAREDAKAAQKKVEEYAAIAATCGLGCGEREFGEELEAAEAERIGMIQRLLKNDFIKKIVDMAGRMQSTAYHAIETTLDRGEDEMVGVELGGDLSKVLSSELVELNASPELFVSRMVKGELLQYKGAAEKPMGYGPIIVCVDESGSMYGNKNLFAKAFLYGMWVVANRFKREFWVVRFSTSTQTQHVKTPRDITSLLDVFMGGGTDFEKPLREVVRLIEDAQGTNPNLRIADMIFLTDGVGRLSPSVLQEIMGKKAEIRFKVISAIITGVADHESVNVKLALAVLKQFSDEVFNVADIYQEDEFVKKALSIGRHS